MTSVPLQLTPPPHDPAPIFEIFRARYGSQLLTAAVAHFNLFERLGASPMAAEDLRLALELESRPFSVLTTALRALGLLQLNEGNTHYHLSTLAIDHLHRSSPHYVGDYLGLAADAPDVLELVQRLRTNQPADIDTEGAAYIYRDGIRSAMEHRDLARHFTLALSGRAKNVAPALASVLDLGDIDHIVDVACGSGLYSMALLQRHPHLRVTMLDLPEVLVLAREFAQAHGVEDRVTFVEGDMFKVPVTAPGFLFSNVFHDWDVPECHRLIQDYARTLPAGGRLWIHDVYLNDAHDGPLPIALYSAALFTLTEGRAYSVDEYRQWLEASGLSVVGPEPTLVHCGLLTATKESPLTPRSE